MFREAWNRRLAQSAEITKTFQAKLKGIERDIDKLLDRIVDASNPNVFRAYEKKVASLEHEKALTEEGLVRAGTPRHTLEESFELALEFPLRPWTI